MNTAVKIYSQRIIEIILNNFFVYILSILLLETEHICLLDIFFENRDNAVVMIHRKIFMKIKIQLNNKITKGRNKICHQYCVIIDPVLLCGMTEDRLTYYGAIDPPNTTRVHYIIEVASFGIALIRSDYMYYVKYVVMNEVLSRLET